MDYMEKSDITGKTFVIYGAGAWGKQCLEFLVMNGGKVEAIIDNQKAGMEEGNNCRVITYKEYIRKGFKGKLVLAIQKSKSIWTMLEKESIEYYCYSPAFEILFSGQKKIISGDVMLDDSTELSRIYTGLSLKMKTLIAKKIKSTSSYIMATTLRDVKIHNKFVYGADYIRMATLEQAIKEIERRKISGAMAELGVYKGEFARVMNNILPNKDLYLFDTFEGFDLDETYREKERKLMKSKLDFKDTTVEEVLRIMKNPESVIVKKGYFPKTAFEIQEHFCLVSIDCDLFDSVYAGLIWFYDKLEPGGYIFVHDCVNEDFLGAKEALIRFADDTGVGYVIIPDNCGTAVITKPYQK